MATRVPHSFDSNSNFTHDISGLPPAVDHSMGPTIYGTLSSIEIGSSASAAEQFSHCFKKLCSLRPTKNPSVKTELNLLFDQLISENYRGYLANTNIKLEDVCALLVQASRLVPLNQEHLVIKLCQLIHQLLNQLQVIVDEQTLDTLVTYCTKALHTCSSWTHPEVLLAVASLVYGNGPRCQQHLPALLGEDGVLLRYTDPAQSDVELRRCSVHCMASLCLGVAGQPCLEEPYRRVCFRTFLRTLQSPKPAGVEDIVFCTLLQSALKGMQCFLNCGKWKAGPGEELGSLLAVLKKFMFFGLPGVTFEMPQVLFPAPLPQYEGLSSAKPETPPNTSTPHKLPGPNKKRKSRGRGKKGGMEGKRDGAGEEGEEDEVPAKTGGGERKGELLIGPSQNSVTPGLVLSVGAPQFCPSWRKESSDSEFSDPDGGMQSKLRLYQARVRLAALNCFLSVVKCVEKKMLHGYWSSFIPDGPTPGAPPPLSLLTIALKDPSPKVRAGSLQVLSALLEGSRQFLSVAEDTGTPRQAFTPFSATLAASLRELHRCLLLALLAESSSQTLTQVIKCLAHLVSNVPYNRLKPGLLSPLWRQIRPYVHHRDVNVRVSSLTLLGALVSSQAPLPEVQLLLEQPWPQMAPGPPGGAPPQEQALSWRQPTKRESPQSPVRPQGPRQGPLWLLQLCVALVTQPRDDSHSHSDSDGAATTASASLEPSPVRLEALQVLAHLVKGYFRLTEGSLLELAQLSARCLQEHDPSVQLHGAKLLEELGTGIVQQYRADGTAGPSASRVPVSQVVEFWKEVLGGPLIAALQNEQHATLQTSACDTLSTILPQAFSQLPDKTQVLCITMLLGLTYSENSLVKAAAVRALGVYILFPTLREDVMFVADTANAILTALDDRSPNVRAKAAWSLGNLTDTLIVNMDSVGQEFQEEFSDMLLLKMLKCATQATGDKDRVKSNAVRALGNLLHFLRPEHLSRSGFEQPLQEAFCALIHTVRGEATMKVRWNACYALGNAFRNPSLPLGTASWSVEAFSTLSHVVTSCKNFKVRIKCAAALSVPTCRRHYGDASQFAEVWHALAQALEHSEDTEDFLEYRYCASLRAQLCHALLHLLFLCQPEDLATLAPSLAGQSGPALRGFLARYLSEGEGAAVVGEENNPGEEGGACVAPQDRLRVLNDTLTRLRGLEPDPKTHSRKHADIVVGFLEDLLKSCEETKETSFSCASLTA